MSSFNPKMKLDFGDLFKSQGHCNLLNRHFFLSQLKTLTLTMTKFRIMMNQCYFISKRTWVIFTVTSLYSAKHFPVQCSIKLGTEGDIHFIDLLKSQFYV